MKWVIVVLLVLIAAGGGYVYLEREQKRKEAESWQRISDAVRRAAEQKAEEDREKRKQAILEGRAEIGMSKYELRKAWNGRAGIEVNRQVRIEGWAEAGVYEEWHTHDKRYGVAGLDVDGVVIRLARYRD